MKVPLFLEFLTRLIPLGKYFIYIRCYAPIDSLLCTQIDGGRAKMDEFLSRHHQS